MVKVNQMIYIFIFFCVYRLKFDDDRVIPTTLKEVLEDNYGGEPLGATDYRGLKRSTNAYMLVYIRESMQDEILAEVSEQDIPAHLGINTILFLFQSNRYHYYIL